MTPEEARLELDATTLRPNDASAEARDMAAKDPELGAWLARRTEFDERVADAMDDIVPVPGDLHMKLLAMSGMPLPVKKKVIPRAVMWLAAAAAFLLMFGGWWWTSHMNGEWQSEALAHVKLVQHGLLPLQHRAKKLDDLMKLVASTDTAMPQSLPAGLMKLGTYGCRTVQIAGKPAMIVCFELSPGKEAHLVVMNHSDLASAPPMNAPVFSTQDGWTMAAWSSGTQSFMLATSEDSALLKKLFS
jgi:hypothetical protein